LGQTFVGKRDVHLRRKIIAPFHISQSKQPKKKIHTRLCSFYVITRHFGNLPNCWAQCYA